MTVAHTGAGVPSAIVQSRAALPLKAPLSTGYAIKRSVTLVEQKNKAGMSRGDVYRVTLDIDAQTDMTWVVVDDPIPSGAAISAAGSATTRPCSPPAKNARAGPGRRSSSARIRHTGVLRVRSRGPLQARIHGASQQPRQVRAAPDAGRGHVQPGVVRRGAEPECRGAAVIGRRGWRKPQLPPASRQHSVSPGFAFRWRSSYDVVPFAEVRAGVAPLTPGCSTAMASRSRAHAQEDRRRGDWAELNDVSPAFLSAALAAEDGRFQSIVASTGSACWARCGIPAPAARAAAPSVRNLPPGSIPS